MKLASLCLCLCCRVHYTPKLREHDVGVLTLNQVVLDIPPGKPSRATVGHQRLVTTVGHHCTVQVERHKGSPQS